MTGLRIAWDPPKAAHNLRKHGVGFPEAATAFLDDMGELLPDPDHSNREDRFVLLGRSIVGRLLVVVHTYRRGGTLIRLISARLATPRERRQYLLGLEEMQ